MAQITDLVAKIKNEITLTGILRCVALLLWPFFPLFPVLIDRSIDRKIDKLYYSVLVTAFES